MALAWAMQKSEFQIGFPRKDKPISSKSQAWPVNSPVCYLVVLDPDGSLHAATYVYKCGAYVRLSNPSAR